ncbi:MAG: prolyl oligopeptidase family serine peptidase [Acidobacteria bacterium]|nr:prolyl oligopeptidase family serine peptidase [Acidobacteriota bacterium]
MRLLIPLLLAVCALAAERPVPPSGVPVPDKDRADLEAGLKRLSAAVDKIKDHVYAPDVMIFCEAVRYALTYNEFFKVEEIARAKDLLRQGQERADALLSGKAPWTRATGLVVRGYRSRIDDSIQPYGLVVPPTWSAEAQRRWRLDAWFHGRNETLSEVNFLTERQTRPGEFTPTDTIVLHLYGRYCNANKFAGEVDLFEALADVTKHYAIDDNRVAVRGFSMGGAAAWHIAAHYAGLWAAAAPGAGFSETADFLKVFQSETVKPAWFEQKLWRMYDATEYALNFFNLPLVAYSGEIDRQKQAADIMAKYLEEEGMRMTHIIGPQTPHRYHPDSKVEIDRRMDVILAKGRDPYPRTVKFTTYTLAYNRMKWVAVDSLAEHWEKAIVKADVSDPRTVVVDTQNVTAFTLDFGPGGCPLHPDGKPTVKIDGQSVAAPGLESDRSWRVHFRKSGSQWKGAESPREQALAKRHHLQGPIDDAFLRRFIFVLPTGQPLQKGVAVQRIAEEQARAIREWRRQFRGDAIVKKDSEITDADIASSNLILWGDNFSNKMIARIADRIPVVWTERSIKFGGKSFDPSTHYPAFLYPNPLNQERYVVINSGFTYREYDYLNNARQIPKLPDWAMIDATTAADGRWPGRIADAGFFNERWQLKEQ